MGKHNYLKSLKRGAFIGFFIGLIVSIILVSVVALSTGYYDLLIFDSILVLITWSLSFAIFGAIIMAIIDFFK